MKYIRYLHESGQKELKLFEVKDISEASMKVMGIKKKIAQGVIRATSSRKAVEKQDKKRSKVRSTSRQLRKIIATIVISMHTPRSAGSFTPS